MSQTFPTRITHNNRTFTQEKDIAELFNNFFVNIGPTLAREIKTDHTDPLQYIESTPLNSFYLAPVTQTPVFTLFVGLKENKASLIVPNKLIKLATERCCLHPLLKYIMNQYYQGSFLKSLRYQK